MRLDWRDHRRLGLALAGAVIGAVAAGRAAAQVAGGGAADRPTADGIIARHIAARGGLGRLRQVETVRLTGRISFASGVEGADTVDLARPNRVRTQVIIQGKVFVQAYDGHTAWGINPFQGDTSPRPLEPNVARNVIAAADLEGPLVDYTAKGNRVSLAGTDTADGRPAYKLVVVEPDGLTDTYYIDTVTYLQTKWEGERVVNGERVVFESFFRDHRPVEGVMFPFRIDSDTKGRPGGQHIVYDSIQVNFPEPDSRFVMPSAPGRL